MLDLTLIRGFMLVWSGFTLAVRMIYARRARGRKARSGTEKTAPHPLGILAMGSWCVVIGVFIIMPEWVMSLTFYYSSRWMGQALGIIGLLCGFWLLVRAHQALGDFYDIKLFVKDAHRVIDTGPYGYVRHPMYTTYFIWLASTVLLLPHYIFPVLLIMAVIGFYLMARREEQMLSEALGESYRTYMKRTGMFLPKW